MGTKIEYLDETWNPIAMRCSRVSPGCLNCWHLKRADLSMSNPGLPEDYRRAMAGGSPFLRNKELERPLHWKKPRRIGVQFMGDLFHHDVQADDIEQLIVTMGLAQQHTFLVLTKRPDRAVELIGRDETLPSNIWFGVTVENANYLWRIDRLLQIRVAVRFLSLEPLLGPVDLDLDQFLFCESCNTGYRPYGKGVVDDPLSNAAGGKPWSDCYECRYNGFPKLDWVIVGPETGPGARECKLEWIASVTTQCIEARVPLFVKALPGKRKPVRDIDRIAEILGHPPKQLRQYPEQGKVISDKTEDADADIHKS